MSELQDEYIPYNAQNPRRSTRQRSVVHPYQPPVSRNTVERGPKKSVKSRGRDIKHYQNHGQTAEAIFSRDLAAQSFSAGIIRIPLREEVCQMALFSVQMRLLENTCLKTLKNMLEEKNDPHFTRLLIIMKKCIAVLDWELDERNIRPTDLPTPGNPDNVYADISTWLVHFFDQLHEFPHRITDVLFRAKKYLTATEFKSLKKMENEAYKKVDEFEAFVKRLKLTGNSASVYKKLRDSIRSECKACL